MIAQSPVHAMLISLSFVVVQTTKLKTSIKWTMQEIALSLQSVKSYTG